jgi:hypothetical protein
MAHAKFWWFVLKNWHTVWGVFALALCLRLIVDLGTETIQFLQAIIDGKIELNWKTFLVFLITSLVSAANLLSAAISTKFQEAQQKAAVAKQTPPTSPS